MSHVISQREQLDENVELAMPSESNAERGQVCLFDVVLSEGIRFVDEHGTHVIRSTEFDVYGEAETLQDALVDFREHAEALFEYLAGSMDADATEHELLIAATLGSRLVHAYSSWNSQFESQSWARALLQTALRSRLNSQRRRAFWHPILQSASSGVLVG